MIYWIFTLFIFWSVTLRRYIAWFFPTGYFICMLGRFSIFERRGHLILIFRKYLSYRLKSFFVLFFDTFIITLHEYNLLFFSKLVILLKQWILILNILLLFITWILHMKEIVIILVLLAIQLSQLIEWEIFMNNGLYL